jgi:hypothetical protein
MVRRALVILSCCVLVSSCSWAFVKAPPADHPTAADECTDSRLAPTADVAWTAMFGLTALIVSGRCYQKAQGGVEQDGSPSEPCSPGAYVGLSATGVLAIAAAVSAYSGFRDTGRCRDRRALETPIASGR